MRSQGSELTASDNHSLLTFERFKNPYQGFVGYVYHFTHKYVCMIFHNYICVPRGGMAIK